MLKLERERKSHEIRVHLRTRDAAFDALFWQAFGIACALHMGAFLFFHIAPIKMSSSFLFPPVQVHTPLLHASQLQLLAQEDMHETYEEPPFPQSLLPAMPKTILLPEEKLVTTELILNHPFQHLDQIQQLEALHSSYLLFYQPLHFSISGDLNERTLLAGPSLLQPQQAHGPFVTYELEYAIQVDELSGEVRGYEKIHASQEPRLDRWADKHIVALKFEPSKQAATGYVHFTLTKPYDTPLKTWVDGLP